jgi:hypothetical protein
VLRFNVSAVPTLEVDAGGAVVHVRTDHAIIVGVPQWTPAPAVDRGGGGPAAEDDVLGQLEQLAGRRHNPAGEDLLTRWLLHSYWRGDPTAKLDLAAGDPVTVVGRFHRSGVFASGPESLFIVRGSPAQTLRSLRTPVFVNAAFVVAIALLCAVGSAAAG